MSTTPPLRSGKPRRGTALAAHLDTTCLGALALAVLASTTPAQGRGFAATGSVVQGNAQITLGATSTDIDVRSQQVVINWTEDAGTPPSLFPDFTIDFLPANSTASFSGSNEAAAGYTVLNRVLLSGRAAFNGTVQSQVGTATGGEVWFYSPNGIYVGPQATINVGSLVLTANDIDTSGGLYGPNGEIRFRGETFPAFDAYPPEVYVDRGARVSALGSGAYMALVAPSIVQHGQLEANGSIALVAAERTDITFNAGVLDIVVSQGTTAINGINHSGTTGGPVTGGAQNIRMVAIPKNVAMTMLLSGTVGYRPAAQVTTDGTTVVLESGSSSSPAGSIQMGEFGDVAFTSPLQAFATGSIEVAPAQFRRVDFRSSAALTAGSDVTLSAVQDSRINADAGVAIFAGNGANGGTANIIARHLPPGEENAGRIDIASLLSIDVRGETATGDAAGGAVTFDAAGGRIAAERIAIDASGVSGGSGAGTGGDVLFLARGDGRIDASFTDVLADGIGAAASSAGGDAVGGTIAVRSASGRLALGNGTLGAGATAGAGALQGGDTLGGSVLLEVGPTGEQAWNSLSIDTSASTGLGGSSTGGSVAATIAPGREVVVGGDLTVRAAGGLAPGAASLALTGSDAKFRVGSSADIDVAGGIAIDLGPTGALEVGGALTVATPGAFGATSLVQADSMSILADSGIAASVLVSNGATLLRAPSGAIVVAQDLRSTGPVTADAQAVDIISTQSLDFARATASAGDLSVETAGDLALDLVDADGEADLRSGGDLGVGGLNASRASLAASGSVALAGAADVAESLIVDAGGLVSVSAQLAAETIVIGAADLDFGANARIGMRGTTRSVLLRKIPAATPASIGGQGQAAGFRLDANEAARLFADEAITIELPFSTTTARASLGDLAMRFGPDGNVGTGGTLRLHTTGHVDVVGAVELTTQSDEDRFGLSARSITLDPARGRIAMTAGNVLRGRLELAADRIIAANPDVRATIEGGASPAAITTALGAPVGPANDGGYFQAGRIGVAVVDGFFVQNSGAETSFAARRGFSANQLAILTTSSSALIAINGRAFNAGGSPLTGLTTVQALTINGQPAAQAQGVNPLSSVNGCVLGADCSLVPPPPGPRAPLSTMIGADIIGALESVRATDSTRFPDGREPLAKLDGISLLERNETLMLEPLTTPELLPRGEVVTLSNLLTRDQQSPDSERSPSGEALPGTQPPAKDDMLSRQLLPYLAYFGETDPARQDPLIDEPITGVGNDDLWQGNCGLDSRDPACPTDEPANANP